MYRFITGIIQLNVEHEAITVLNLIQKYCKCIDLRLPKENKINNLR